MNHSRRTRPRSSDAILLAGVVLVAINLRPAAASIGPLISRIEHDTGLSSGWASALTTLPVLCFGALAPLAPVLAKRFGVRSSLAGAMVVLLAGIAMRLVPGDAFLFIGTALAGSAIATGNVLLPVLVRRDFSGRTATVMALYSTALVGFAALAAGVSVPIADAFGGGWKGGLGIWAVPAAVAALVWAPWLWRRDGSATSAGGAAAGRADHHRFLLHIVDCRNPGRGHQRADHSDRRDARRAASRSACPAAVRAARDSARWFAPWRPRSPDVSTP